MVAQYSQQLEIRATPVTLKLWGRNQCESKLAVDLLTNVHQIILNKNSQEWKEKKNTSYCHFLSEWLSLQLFFTHSTRMLKFRLKMFSKGFCVIKHFISLSLSLPFLLFLSIRYLKEKRVICQHLQNRTFKKTETTVWCDLAYCNYHPLPLAKESLCFLECAITEEHLGHKGVQSAFLTILQLKLYYGSGIQVGDHLRRWTKSSKRQSLNLTWNFRSGKILSWKSTRL